MSRRLARRTLAAMGLGASFVLVPAVLPIAAAPVPRGAVAGTSSLDAIDCPTASRCIAVGSDASGNGKSVVVDTSSSAGTTWSGDLSNQTLFGVACPTSTDCVAAAIDQLARVNVANGAMTPTGKVTAPSGEIAALDRVDCPSATECFAVGFIGGHSHSEGLVVRTSATGSILAKTEEASKSGFGAIACPTATTCLLAAADFNNPETIQLLTNGHLGAQRALAANLYVQQLACYRNVVCYALLGKRTTGTARTDLLYALDPATGAVTAKHTIAGTFSADGIACGAATQCIVTGFSGTSAAMVIVTNGVPGTSRHIAGSSVSAVACTSSNACFSSGQTTTEGFVQRL